MFFLLEPGELFLKLLLVCHFSNVILPFVVIKGGFLRGWFSRHRLFIEGHIHSVVHEAGLAENGIALA